MGGPFAVEWLRWPIRDWHQLDGMGLHSILDPDIEASLYLIAEHHPAEIQRLTLSGRSGASFHLHVSARADVDDGERRRRFEVAGTCRVTFTGIMLAGATAEDAKAMVAQHMALRNLQPARPMEPDGWLLAPQASPTADVL